jgi:hypothetical protein
VTSDTSIGATGSGSLSPSRNGRVFLGLQGMNKATGAAGEGVWPGRGRGVADERVLESAWRPASVGLLHRRNTAGEGVIVAYWTWVRAMQLIGDAAMAKRIELSRWSGSHPTREPQTHSEEQVSRSRRRLRSSVL